jgi:hypothetical protein
LLVDYEPNVPCFKLARPLSEGLFVYNDPYSVVKGGFEGGVAHLAYPSVNYHIQGKLPSRRKVLVHQIWERQPTDRDVNFEVVADGGRFVVETLQMRVDFEKRKISAKGIPYVDWLKQPENAKLLKRMRRHEGVSLPESAEEAFAKFKISLVGHGKDKFDRKTADNLRLMDEICEELGMPKGEVLRIADIMLQVWSEYDEWLMQQPSRQKGKKRAKQKSTQPSQPSVVTTVKVRRPRTTKARQAPY